MSLIITDVNSREELAEILGPAIAREFQARFEEKNAEIARLTAALSAAQEREATLKEEVERVRADGMAHHEHIIDRYRLELAAAAKRAEEQADLRRVAEDAIPRGIEVAKEFIRAEYERRLSLAERVVEAAGALSDTDPDYEEHGVLRVDDGPFKAMRAAVADADREGT